MGGNFFPPFFIKGLSARMLQTISSNSCLILTGVKIAAKKGIAQGAQQSLAR
jgi:hypothetical protein